MKKQNEPSIWDFLKSLFSSQWEAISLPKKPDVRPRKEIEAVDSAKREWGAIDARWFLVAFAAAVMALFMIPRLGREESFVVPILAWLLSLVAYWFAFDKTFRSLLASSRSWWLNNRSVWLPLGLLTLLAAVLRFIDLGSIPYVLSGDEAAQGLEALRVINGEIRNPFETGWTGVPTMSFYVFSLTIRLFGATALGMRLPAAILGSLSIPVVFFLFRRLADARIAWLATGLLTTYHYHIHFSRLGAFMVLDPLFAALSLLFLHRAISKKGKAIDWVLLGMAPGLALYFYAGSRFVAVLIAALLFYFLIKNPREFLRNNGQGLLISMGAFVIVAAPMLQLAIRFPDEFNSRVNQIGILQNGWLENEIVITGKSARTLLWEQFSRAALAFNFYADRTVWYGLRTPLQSPIFGALMALGVGFSSLRLLLPNADSRLAYFVAWFWGPIIAGGMLTVDPPSSMRLVTLSIPVCFFIAFSWDKLMSLSSHLSREGVRRIALIALALLFGVTSVNTYFREFSPQHIAGGPRAEFASLSAPILEPYLESHDIVFFGEPFMSWNFATYPYLLPDARVINMPAELDLSLLGEFIVRDRGLVFVFIPERQAEVLQVETLYPGGELLEFRTESEWNSVATLYVLEGD